MVRLSDAGWSIPHIAKYLARHEYVVRRWIKSFLAGGFAALSDLPHLGRRSHMTPDLIEQVRRKTREPNCVWTAGQLAQWLAQEYGVVISASHLGRVLRQARLSYKRTKRSLKHKQDPEKLAQSKTAIAEIKKGLGPA